MQVRLAFSVSIHANRDILLMDEVLAVGDSNFQSKCLEEFNKYRDAGRTVIIVTHDIAVVQRYCDRAMLLRNGKVKKIGKAEDVANEYIHENMGDEEKRMTSSSSVTASPRSNPSPSESAPKPQKVAEITKVEFLDKDGNKKSVFQTGDDMSVRVYFKVNRKVDELNFGVAIFNQENDYIFGINTILDKINVKRFVEKEFFEVLYTKVPLKTNVYFVKVGLFGKFDSTVYDFLEKSSTVKFASVTLSQGTCEIPYSWKNNV